MQMVTTMRVATRKALNLALVQYTARAILSIFVRSTGPHHRNRLVMVPFSGQGFPVWLPRRERLHQHYSSFLALLRTLVRLTVPKYKVYPEEQASLLILSSKL